MFLFKRGNFYHFEYFDDDIGKKKRVSTKCKSKIDATKYISKYFHTRNAKKINQSLTLLEFAEEFMKYSEVTYSIKYQKNIKVAFKLFQEYIGNPTLSDIKQRDAEKYILSVHQRAKYSASLYFRTLKSAFNKAIQWNYLSNNPFNEIKLPKIEANIPNTISPNELDLVLSFTYNPILKEMFFTAYYTGLRQSELVNLKWSSVDFDRKVLIVANSNGFTTKNKKERVIPMNNFIYSQLLKLSQNVRSEYVFPNKNYYKLHPDNVSHKFKQAVRKAKLSEGIHFHSLRHSFASNLVQKGVSLYVVKELLGHESISTTQIYAHLDNAALVRAVNLLSE